MVVLPVGILKLAVVPPDANCTVRSVGPLSGANVRMACPVIGAAKALLRVIVIWNCCAGPTELGIPARVAVGGAGRLIFNVKRSDTLVRALSVTVMATPKLPAAVGVPPIWPVAASMVMPLGSPAAFQR